MNERITKKPLTPEAFQRESIKAVHRSEEEKNVKYYLDDELKTKIDEARQIVEEYKSAFNVINNSSAFPKDIKETLELEYEKADITFKVYEDAMKARGLLS